MRYHGQYDTGSKLCLLLCLLIIAGCLLQGCKKLQSLFGKKPAQIAAQPIPNGKDVRTQKDFRNETFSWLHRQTVETYLDRGQKDPQWTAAAEQFLTNSCLFATRQPSSPSPEDLEQEGKRLRDTGCDDPLVELWYGKALLAARKYEMAEHVISNVLPRLQQGNYPLIHQFYTTRALSDILFAYEGEQDEDAKKWLVMSLGMLAQSIANGEFQKTELPIAFRLTANFYARRYHIPAYRTVYENLLEYQGTIDPWLLKSIQGTAEKELAWEKRGGGYANTVSKEAWKEFYRHLENARNLLTEAWKLHPEYPEAAAEMIVVVMGERKHSEETERTWFDRAVAAQMDYAQAYTNILGALMPRWGGSHDAMYAFGEECLATGRFDTDVPLFYLVTLSEIGEDLEYDGWRGAFRKPGVHDNLNRLFQGLLQEPGRQHDHERIIVQQALTEAWCGNYEQAKTMIATIPTRINLRDGFLNRFLSWKNRSWDEIEAELRAFTGLQKELLQQAETLLLEKKRINKVLTLLFEKRQINKALSLFEQAMQASRDDKAVHAYILERIGFIQMGYRSSEIHNGQKPLHTAALKGHADVAAYLIEQGADINLPGTLQWAPLHLAIAVHQQEVARKLIEKGADLNVVTYHQYTPLHQAIYYQEPEIASLLVQKGAALNKKDYEGLTPLIMSLKANQPTVAKLIAEHGADPNIPSESDQWTPLHLAAYYGYVEVAKVLLANGANVQARLPTGHTPLEIAKNQNQKEMVELLSQQ